MKCRDGTLYTGITTSLERRINEHNYSSRGAKYTRSRRPVELVYSRLVGTRSEASKEEYKVKKMTRQQKISLYKDI